MQLGWNGATGMKADPATEIEAAQRAGFSFIELNAAKLRRYLEGGGAAAELASLLEAARLRPLSIGPVDRVTYAGEQWERVEREYREVSRLGGELGCDFLSVGPGSRPAGAADGEVKDETISVLEGLADIASGDGLKLGFQFQSYPSCSVRTMELAWEIVSELDRPEVGLVIDSFHVYAGGSAISSVRRMKASKLLVFQVGDCENLPLPKLQAQQHRLLPGAGVAPIHRIWQELNSIGFERWVSVKAPRPEYWERDPFQLAAEARQALEKCLASPAAKKT
jgi:2-keto-myo-inositol isomerase